MRNIGDRTRGHTLIPFLRKQRQILQSAAAECLSFTANFLVSLQLLPFVCLPATFSPTCPHLQYSAIFQGRLAFSANYHALYFYYLHHLQRCTCKITLTCCCCSSIPLRFGYYRRQNKQKCLASNTRSLKSRRYLPRGKFISRHQEHLGRQTTSL